MQLAEERNDSSTEERIKAAARTLFHQKGFAGTRTREIAEEAGINLALLNYYFRSKQKLFEQVMFETLISFMQNMVLVFSDEDTSLEEKVEKMADKYIDFVIREPNVPMFILSEIRRDMEGFMGKFPVGQIFLHSPFVRQYEAAVKAGKISEPNILHFIMNLLSMLIFPFLSNPLLKAVGGISDDEFREMMLERKKLIPMWMKAMFIAE